MFEPTVINSEPLVRLEREALHVLNEVFANFENPKLSFSSGKDSICIAHLASKLFATLVGKFPFELYHYDSGDNFPEVLEYRDAFARKINSDLKIFSVKKEENQQVGSIHNIIELIHASVNEFHVDALIGGGRRDEESSRSKERIFSIRGANGNWDPHFQRPEPWKNYNTRLSTGEHMRVFPLSNWTELDVWRYLAREQVELPGVYFAKEREVFVRSGIILAYHSEVRLREGESVEIRSVRCRTVGDRGTSGFVESDAASISDIIKELESSSYSERAGRYEDTTKDTGMETRKISGWF